MHWDGMGREIIDDKNKVGNLKSIKNIVVYCGGEWMGVFTSSRNLDTHRTSSRTLISNSILRTVVFRSIILDTSFHIQLIYLMEKI